MDGKLTPIMEFPGLSLVTNPNDVRRMFALMVEIIR